ncbi:MAG: hypothetical protein AAB802_01255 [Patescibacteria group bacterium]
MCSGIEFDHNGQQKRVLLTDPNPRVLIRYKINQRWVRWGNIHAPELPKTAHCKKEALLMGKWKWARPRLVEIVANRGFANGTWFQVREGMHGLLVRDLQGQEIVYMLTEPATHYYKTMTGAERMPILLHQVI